MMGGVISLGKLLIKNPGDIKILRQMEPLKERYIRPQMAYDLPKYKDGMK
jgi:hypothetical protein